MKINLRTKVCKEGKLRQTFWVWFIKCKRDEFKVTRPTWKYLTVTCYDHQLFWGVFMLFSAVLYVYWSLHTTGCEASSATREMLWHRRGRTYVRNLGNLCGIGRWTVDNAPCSCKLSIYGSPVRVPFHRSCISVPIIFVANLLSICNIL